MFADFVSLTLMLFSRLLNHRIKFSFFASTQTREHAMSVKTAGVRYLVLLINKMDDPTVSWNQARYVDQR